MIPIKQKPAPPRVYGIQNQKLLEGFPAARVEALRKLSDDVRILDRRLATIEAQKATPEPAPAPPPAAPVPYFVAAYQYPDGSRVYFKDNGEARFFQSGFDAHVRRFATAKEARAVLAKASFNEVVILRRTPKAPDPSGGPQRRVFVRLPTRIYLGVKMRCAERGITLRDYVLSLIVKDGIA